MDEHASRRDLLDRVVRLAEDLPESVLEGVARALEDEGARCDPRQQAVRAVLGASARERVQSVLESIERSAPAIGMRDLAWALRGAARARGRQQDAESVELVWTGPAPPGSSLRRIDQALLELVRGAKESILVVTFAAYRVSQVHDALLAAADRGVQLTFVFESCSESLGKVSFDPARAMGPELVGQSRVLFWPLEKRSKDDQGRHGSLHAKCAVADEAALLVSSANLTEYAMHLNIELGLLVRGGALPRLVAGHFERLRVDGSLVP